MNYKPSPRLFPFATTSLLALALAYGCGSDSTENPGPQAGTGATAGAGGSQAGAGGSQAGAGGAQAGAGGSQAGAGGSQAGAGGSQAGAGGSQAGAGGSQAGAGGSQAGAGGSQAGAGGGAGTVDSGAGGKAGDSGTTPLPDARGDVDLTGRTPATCTTPLTPIYGWKNGVVGQVAGDCDWQKRSIDFEPTGTNSTTYPAPTTPFTITDTGNAFGAAQVSNCRAYCFDQGLLIGVDFVNDGNPKNLVGEVIMDFPTVATATNPDVAPFADVRTLNYLGWYHFDRTVDGAQPLPGGTISVNTIVKTTTGIVVSDAQVWDGPDGSWAANNDAPVIWRGLKTGWNEIKYFPITNGFKTVPADQAKLVNVTGIGLRFTWKNPPAGAQWHNVVAIDHVQIRP